VSAGFELHIGSAGKALPRTPAEPLGVENQNRGKCPQRRMARRHISASTAPCAWLFAHPACQADRQRVHPHPGHAGLTQQAIHRARRALGCISHIAAYGRTQGVMAPDAAPIRPAVASPRRPRLSWYQELSRPAGERRRAAGRRRPSLWVWLPDHAGRGDGSSYVSQAAARCAAHNGRTTAILRSQVSGSRIRTIVHSRTRSRQG